jgi:hypothetical protein
MNSLPVRIFGLSTALLLAGLPLESRAEAPSAPKTNAGLAKTADKDFGKLSADGVSAFNDIHLARRAIFDGNPNEAAKFVIDAQASLAKAKTSDAVFLKTEAAIRAPGDAMPRPASGAAKSLQTAWIPVDGELELGESFVPTPEKSAAMVTARKSLDKGDPAQTLQTIKLAQIDVNYTMAIAPLEATIASVAQANTLMGTHDYYGASQALRQAETAIRFDEVDDVANVNTQTASKAK